MKVDACLNNLKLKEKHTKQDKNQLKNKIVDPNLKKKGEIDQPRERKQETDHLQRKKDKIKIRVETIGKTNQLPKEIN